MKSRPILFSAPMVRALLAGTKTQTRRIVKPTKVPYGHWGVETRGARHELTHWDNDTAETSLLTCPHGEPGDQLWVRETWAEGIHQMADVDHWAYAADHFGVQQRLGERWKPSIHMPRAASRITLEITEVRVERLGDISEADAWAEGIDQAEVLSMGCTYGASVAAYSALWERINGPGSWDLNPWVWALDFRRIT